MRFHFATYNIHKGIGGVDRRYKIERVIETLGSHDLDIVFLQEVDEGVPRSRFERQVDVLGDALGLRHRAFQPNVRLKRGQYGNAIISRYPLHDVVNIDLSVPLKKKRRGLAARCRISDGEHSRTVCLVNVHLGLAGFERTIQVRRLIADRFLHRVKGSTALVAAGDFNDVWGGLGKRLLEPIGFACAGKIRTFPAISPVRPLDRIYFRGGLDLVRCFRPRSRVASLASDHLPLFAEFDVP